MYLDNNICMHCFVERILNDNERNMYNCNQVNINCGDDDECYYCGEWGPIVTGYSYCDNNNCSSSTYDDYAIDIEDDDDM